MPTKAICRYGLLSIIDGDRLCIKDGNRYTSPECNSIFRSVLTWKVVILIQCLYITKIIGYNVMIIHNNVVGLLKGVGDDFTQLKPGNIL